MTHKPRILVDFDGVIHRYSRGWDDGTAYDGPVTGSKEALKAMEVEGYEVVIFSTRNAEQIEFWLAKYGFPAYRVTNVKEPAWCQIDDRAIRFIDWDQAINDVQMLYPIEKKLVTPEQLREMEAKLCPTCQGVSRETTNMVCQTCGRDYMRINPRPTKVF